VGLVADDLTGATDSAVQFAEAGWTASVERVLLRQQDELSGDRPAVIAVATGVRAAAAAHAADRTASAVRRLSARGVDRLFIKIDSTIRGSVAGQVRGALSAWTPGGRPTAVICPAFPELGRTVVGGAVLVDGIPVSDTAAADDPVTPVAESRLDVLLPGAVLANPIDLLTGSAARSDDLLVFDAATVDDLARIAEVLDRLGRPAVAVGSAGLAKAVAARWGGSHPAPRPAPASRLLVTVSSLHPAALLQLARLRDYLSRCEDHDVQILTGPPERSDAAHATDIATQLAADVAGQLQKSAYDGLVLVGGDGAAAVLDQLQVESVRIYSAVVPGAPDGRVVGGTADGLRLITKSGGFGGPDTLITIVQRLRSAHLASEAACA
jgi:uncharacterized protein YgbK (DUF1537 family)